MPVRKFRSVEAMSQPHWRRPGDPALYAAMAGLWEMGTRIQKRRFPPGVHRHRSVQDMNAAVEQWHREHIAQYSQR
ncbi:MAG: hypothetical protein LC791_01110 [Acidobacteria bacterium]|nr:hypothetical protein [Acidobacteriota bacterium]